MSKKNSFNVGDLVFAKVKGYPAWPAKIVDITKSKKYSVYFYGTGETANVQGKDISLYVNTKQKFATNVSMKKPNFKAAIEQIELALNGEDPAPISYDIPLDKTNATLDSTLNSTLNSTLDTTELSTKTANIDETIVEEDNGDVEFDSDTKGDVAEIDKEIENSLPETIEEKEETTTTPTITTTDAIVELNRNPTPPAKDVAKAVEPKSVSTTPEAKSDAKTENKAEVSRVSGRVIKKTKYFQDEFEDSPQIPMKRKRPSESQVPATKIARKTDDSGATDESNEGEIKQVSQIIMNEVNLLQYDVDIKSSLQLSSADTTRCISVLEKYKSLEVTPLMLKKNPQVAETIKRLRRYVGNTKEWNFSDEQRVEFNEKATKIRKLAELIYKNFKKLFNFPSNVPFWQGFTEEVQSFKEQTKSLTHEELITLTEDVQPAMNENIGEVKNSIRV